MADTGFLGSLIAWAEGAAESIRSERVSAVVEICPPTSNRAAILHIDSDKVVARVTFWTDGSYHAEALDAAAGDSTFTRHGHLAGGTLIEGEFEDFLALLRGPSG